MARLIEGIEPLRNREANCAAHAVQKRHSPLRHLFARSVSASSLIVSVALQEARLDARTKSRTRRSRHAARTEADARIAFPKQCAATAAHVVHRAPTPTTFQYRCELVAKRAAERA